MMGIMLVLVSVFPRFQNNIKIGGFMTVCIDIADGFELEVTGKYNPGADGRFSGLPEDCYPDEPSDFDFEDVVLIVEKNDKKYRIPADHKLANVYDMELISAADEKYLKDGDE